MKVVINTCFGGFSLSALAVARLAELQGRKAYFFVHDYDKPYGMPVDPADITKRSWSWSAFDVSNPDEVLPTQDNWQSLSTKERVASNALWAAHTLDIRPSKRHDPLLVQVVEELGEAANGSCAELRVVEIPDGVDYEIDEYDGNEHVAEKHRTWR